MGCVSSSKAVRFNCMRRTKPNLKVWDDNKILRDAEMQQLTPDQLIAFNLYWDEFVRYTMAMSAEKQTTYFMAIDQRRDDPDLAEAWHSQMKQLFDQNSQEKPGYLNKEECLIFIAGRKMLQEDMSRPSNAGLIIEEEHRESSGELEWAATASLAQSNGVGPAGSQQISSNTGAAYVTLEDILRVDRIMQCWRDAGKMVATMPSSMGSHVLQSPIQEIDQDSIALERPQNRKSNIPGLRAT